MTATRFFISFFFVLFFSSPVFAHRDDYLDETLVYLTLEKNETELEYWFDRANSPSHFVRHNFAAEHGFSDKWMLDGRITFANESGRHGNLGSWRVETRYRFYEEGSKPIDIAASGEINRERSEEDGVLRTGIEPRLILSKDYHEHFNTTVNLSEEIPLSGGDSSFNTAFGFRDNLSSLLRTGFELKYNWNEHIASIVPQIWFTFPFHATLILGYSKGFDKNRANFLRISFEYEF